MAILEKLRYQPCADESDPDDYRPRSSWAAAVDPARSDRSFVSNLCAFVDVVAPGDRVPLHTHPVDELVILEQGTAEVALGDEVREIGAGAMVFVPAETAHGAVNVGDTRARFLGVFSAERIGVRYLQRNPAPGTEGNPPQPPFEVDVRAQIEAGGFPGS